MRCVEIALRGLGVAGVATNSQSSARFFPVLSKGMPVALVKMADRKSEYSRGFDFVEDIAGLQFGDEALPTRKLNEITRDTEAEKLAHPIVLAQLALSFQLCLPLFPSVSVCFASAKGRVWCRQF
jgi:hypothetical protein